MPGASRFLAEKNKKQGCQGWETGADDAETDFDAGPELRIGTSD